MPHIFLLFCFSSLHILEMNCRTFMSIYPRFLLQPRLLAKTRKSRFWAVLALLIQIFLSTNKHNTLVETIYPTFPSKLVSP